MSYALGAMQSEMSQRPDAALEQVLIESARRQDLAAFGRIVDAYQSRVLGFVRRMVRQEDDALDITQEVFIRAYQGMARFDGRSSLRSWLFRIAHNLCVDRARRADRRVSTISMEASEPEDEGWDAPDSRWDPETLALNEELHEVVETAVGTMSEKLRTVLLLHDKEDMGYDEIALTVNVPVGTVKSRLFLAREHLKRAITLYQNGGQVS